MVRKNVSHFHNVGLYHVSYARIVRNSDLGFVVNNHECQRQFTIVIVWGPDDTRISNIRVSQQTSFTMISTSRHPS